MWSIVLSKSCLQIIGPGELEITIPNFDWEKSHVERIDERLIKGWTQITVKYPLENPVSLEMTITSDSNYTVATLSIGEWVTWYTDLDFADRLQDVLLGKA